MHFSFTERAFVSRLVQRYVNKKQILFSHYKKDLGCVNGNTDEMEWTFLLSLLFQLSRKRE